MTKNFMNEIKRMLVSKSKGDQEDRIHKQYSTKYIDILK